VSVLLPSYSSIYPPERPLALESTHPDVFEQQLFVIKPKLEPSYKEEQELRNCAIADNTDILSVSTARGGAK
jgi:hypothetical protein